MIYYGVLKPLNVYKSPPMIFMSSGVPLSGDGDEDLAVCKRSYAGKSIVSPHQWGHTVNPVPRLFRAHPLVFRIHHLR